GEKGGLLRVRTEERIALDLIPVPPAAIDPMGAHLDERAAHAQVGHDLACDGAGGNPHRGLAGGLAAAAAIVAHAILYVIGVIGMSGPILILDVGIVPAALIDIVDHERNRRAGRHLLARRFVDDDAGEDFHRVRFLPLGREARLTWTATI